MAMAPMERGALVHANLHLVTRVFAAAAQLLGIIHHVPPRLSV